MEHIGYALRQKNGDINGVITYEIYTREQDAKDVAEHYDFDVVKVKITPIEQFAAVKMVT